MPGLPGIGKDRGVNERLIMGFHEEVVMKKSVLLLSLLFVFTSIIVAQEMIENPDKPLSKKAGRIL